MSADGEATRGTSSRQTNPSPTLLFEKDGAPLRAIRRTGVLLLLAAAVTWSLNGVLIKTLQAGGVGGCTIASGRSVFAALLLLPVVGRHWKPIPEKGWLQATV